MRRRTSALWFVAAGLLMKVLVPAGYMPVVDSASFALELCSGFGTETMAMSKMAMPHGPADRDKIDHGAKPDMSCGFAGHAAAAMAGADPILILLAVAFIVATVFRMPVRQAARGAQYLRPPLRGPPAVA